MGHLLKKHHIALTKSHVTDGIFIAETQNETNFEEETEGAKDLEIEDWGYRFKVNRN
ncbi:999_t:CDS:2 [Funneliformis caledonium]|uniref:999_t:CDS:1 n=1 Tax=Funneliformis caledonium TaxID=1117310 RepID=A0A9N9H8U2_9GLOM|nr:999_t:CDS:2 [Funneliformis caledonium]